MPMPSAIRRSKSARTFSESVAAVRTATRLVRQVILVPQAATATKSGGTLPFTGYLAIPILLIGFVLTITGLAMRRRLGSNQLS